MTDISRSVDFSGAVSGEVVTGRPRAYSDDVLREISSYEQALQIAESFSDLDVVGTGFDLVKDKNILIGVPFVVLQWRFNTDGEYGEYVSADIVTADDQKFILNDGSLGIRDQLRGYTEKRRARGLDEVKAHSNVSAPRGLRKYEFTDREGGSRFKGTATIFYLA